MRRKKTKRDGTCYPFNLGFDAPKSFFAKTNGLKNIYCSGRRNKTGSYYNAWLKYGKTYWVDSAGNKHSVRSYSWHRFLILQQELVKLAANYLTAGIGTKVVPVQQLPYPSGIVVHTNSTYSTKDSQKPRP